MKGNPPSVAGPAAIPEIHTIARTPSRVAFKNDFKIPQIILGFPKGIQVAHNVQKLIIGLIGRVSAVPGQAKRVCLVRRAIPFS